MSVDLEKYAFSFSHAIIKAADQQFTGVSNVTLSQDIDRSATYGTSRKPQKRSAGQLKLGEGTLHFSDLSDAMAFYALLGDDPSLAIFTVDVTLSNEAGEVQSFECLGATLSGFSINFEAGPDALPLEIPFNFMLLKINGKEFAR